MSDMKIAIRETDDITWIIEAAIDLSEATEADLQAIKDKKWYNRLLDTITFSKDDQIHVAKDIGSMAKLQEIIIRVLVMLSQENATISTAIKQQAELLKGLSAKDTALLNALRKIKYGGTSQIDFSDLNREKKALIANLLVMADPEIQRNGNSKRYIESILKIANITTFDNTVNPAAVDDLNREEQELLYRMLMIDRYLKNIDFEEPSDVIDYISVNLKRKNEIRLSIIETASAVTPEFFISYYENNTSTFNDIGIGDIEFKENEYFDDSEEHDDCQYEIDPDEYEETLLANILHIPEGEAYRFEHKNIHMQTIIDCEGKLEFRNCIIHYGENNQVAEIMVKLNGSISMKNCTIEGHSYFKENAFITAESEEFASEFENCTFRNCCSFLRTSYAFSLQGCEVINPGLNFIEERYSHHKNHGLIQNTKFTYNNIPTFVQQSLDGNYGSIISAEQLIFSHCSVIGLLEINSAENAEQIKNSVPTFIRTDKVTMDHILCNGISYFFRGCGEIIHSEFKECNIILSSIFHTERFIVKDCSFEKCTEIGNSLHKTNFVHCQFNCCYNRLISSSGAGDTSIEFCEFNQWSAEKKHGTKYPEIIPHAMIEFSRSKGKNNGSNVIKNCTFNKMIAHRYFVILGKVYEDIGDYVAYVENCNFVNCTTERDSGKIIKEYDHYLGLFKKRRDVKTISIASTCRGLDQVKKV